MKVLYGLIFFLLSGMLNAQSDFVSIERDIIETYLLLKEAHKNSNPERQQIFATKLKQQIMFALVQDGSFYYPYSKLKSHIHIVESKDKKLRIFSWDALASGDWRQMIAFAQYRGVRNESLVHVLSDNEQLELENFNDVCYETIHHLFSNTGKEYYLLIGYGSHGAGQHHSAVRLFSIEHNQLTECDQCFEQLEKSLILKAPIQYSVLVDYHPRRKRLSYNQIYFDNRTQSYQTHYLQFYWKNGRFTW